jgi:hypothetical protein
MMMVMTVLPLYFFCFDGVDISADFNASKFSHWVASSCGNFPCDHSGLTPGKRAKARDFSNLFEGRGMHSRGKRLLKSLAGKRFWSNGCILKVISRVIHQKKRQSMGQFIKGEVSGDINTIKTKMFNGNTITIIMPDDVQASVE